MEAASETGWPKHWPAWVVELLAKLAGAEDSEPAPPGLLDGPRWVDSMSLQIMATMNPKVKMTDPAQSGVRFLGGMLGHDEWRRTSDEGVRRQLERADEAIEQAMPVLDFMLARLRARLSAAAYAGLMAEAEQTERMVTGLIEGGLRIMERKRQIAEEALKIARAQPRMALT